MRKILTLLSLSIILIFISDLSSVARTKYYSCLFKDLPKEKVVSALDSLIISKRYSYLYSNNRKTLFTISTSRISIIISPLILYPLYAANANNMQQGSIFGVELTETGKDTKVTVNGDLYWYGDSTGFKAGKNFIRALKQQYPLTITEEDPDFNSLKGIKSEILNEKKDNVFKDLPRTLNTNKYTRIDPDLNENLFLIKNGIHEKGDRKLEYCNDLFENKPLNYIVKRENVSYKYDIKGNLSKITLSSGDVYPKVYYSYNYPDGSLSNVKINLSNNESYDYSPDGTLLDFAPYIREVDKKIKSNWITYNDYRSYRIVVLIRLNKKGELLNYKVKEASYIKKNDDAAISAIIKSAPFGPLPSAYDGDSIDVTFHFDKTVY